jgi:hypothetical protein
MGVGPQEARLPTFILPPLSVFIPIVTAQA